MDDLERFFEAGLKLRHLRLLTLFAELGQVKLVADKLNVTQPAISKQLAEIEAGLGSAILTRSGNRLRFTSEGEALLRLAREVFHQIDHARYEIDAMRNGFSGKLVVGAVATVLPVLGPRLVIEMKQRAPNVSVTFVESTSDKLIPMLSKGDLDFAFSRIMPAGLDATVFESQRLIEDPIVIVCGRGHPLSFRHPTSPADLAGMQWILPSSESSTFAALLAWMSEHGLSLPSGSVQSTSLATNVMLLQACPVLALMPLTIARKAANAGEITVLELPGARFLHTIWFFHNKLTANAAVPLALECMSTVRQVMDDRHA